MPYTAVQTTSRKDDFKFRILKVMKRIRAYHLHYTKQFIEFAPQYKGQEVLIRNVVSLVTANEQLTADLERFAEHLEGK